MSDDAARCSYSATGEDYEEWGGDPDFWDSRLEEWGVDGNVWKCPHERLDGFERCLFHLPPEEVPEDVDVVERFKEAIDTPGLSDEEAQRRKQFIGATFGELDFGDATLGHDDGHPLVLVGATFCGPVTVSGVVEQSITGNFSLFKEWVIFRGAEMNGSIEFSHSEFRYKVDFQFANVEAEIDLSSAVANRGIQFRNASLHGNLDFSSIESGGALDFFDADVAGGIYGHESNIEESVSFPQTEVNERVSFPYATIGKSVNFSEAKVGGEIDFLEAEIGKRVDFERAIIEGHLNFSESNIYGNAKFRGSQIKGEVGFVAADVKNINFINSQLGDSIYFSGSTVDRSMFFNSVSIAKEVDFSGTVIGNQVQFSSSTVNNDGYFSGITVSGNADFSGSTVVGKMDLSSADIGGDADFSAITIEKEVNLNNAELENNVDFRSAEIRGDSIFSNSTLDTADFRGCDLTDADLDDATLQNANFEQAQLIRATLFGTDLRGAQLNGATLDGVRVDEDTLFLGPPTDDDGFDPHSLRAIWAKPCCVYDPRYDGHDDDETSENSRFDSDFLPNLDLRSRFDILSGPNVDAETDVEPDIDKAKSVYRALEELARSDARPRLESRCFVRRQALQHRQYRNATKEGYDENDYEKTLIAGARWLRASLARKVMLYGESPFRVVATSFLIILAFTLLYPLGGWMRPVEPGGTLGQRLTIAQVLNNPTVLGESFYYSTLTFTTLGFGDFRPVGLGRFLTTVETGLGAILIALLVFVLGRRATR